MDFFCKCIKTVETCLKDAKIEKGSVSEVVLVGGSTRIPKVQCMLQEPFNGKDLCRSINPDEAVAYGAAVVAAKLSGNSDKTVRDLVLLDVTPLSLGIEVKGEVMSVVIPRNTPIPTKKRKIFVTSEDNQYSVSNKVYQGERTRSKNNYLLGKFNSSGIPPAPKGFQKIEDCFEIDADGILTVTSEVLSTCRTKKLIITNHNGRLSKEEIDRMIEDAENYKLEDQEYKRKVDAYNAFEDCIYVMKNRVNDYNIRKKLSSEVLKNLEDAIADATEWLSENHAASIGQLKHKKKELEHLYRIALA